jgi:asparagine N-glycosylation enzyme membrane subunit Stt3
MPPERAPTVHILVLLTLIIISVEERDMFGTRYSLVVVATMAVLFAALFVNRMIRRRNKDGNENGHG